MFIYYLIGFLIFIFNIFLLLKKRKNIDEILKISALLIILVDVMLLIPVSKEVGQSPYGVLLYAFQFGTLNADFSVWINAINNYNIAYKTFFLISIYLTPVLLGGAILSFFNKQISIIKYYILRNFKECFYFSSLNNNSFVLANSIKRHTPKALIVFYNVVDDNNQLLQKAKNLGFYCFSGNQQKLFKVSNKKISIFEIDDDENQNLSETIILSRILKNKYKNDKLNLINIYTFSTQKEAITAICLEKEKYINIILIDKNKYITYNLLNDNPLFKCLKQKENEISILLIGSGKLGKEILKACIWCGQLGNDYKLKISVVDLNAESIKLNLRKDCPELFTSEEYDINFYSCNIEEINFSNIIETKCSKCNYIIVCTDNDSLNYNTSVYLRTKYLQIDPKFKNKPTISTLVRNDIKKENIDYVNSVKGYDFFPFGNDSNIFDYYRLIENPLDKIGFNINSTYYLQKNQNFSLNELRQFYYSDESSRRSCWANALHYKYKLFILGYSYIEKTLATPEQLKNSDEIVNRLLTIQDNKEILTKLSKIEHDRWMAFERTEGNIGMPLDKVKVFFPITNSYKYLLAGIHACICSWNDLDALSKYVSEQTGKTIDFKNLDNQFIVSLVKILGIQNSDYNIMNPIRNIITEL